MKVRDAMARIVHRARKTDKVGDIASTMKQEDIGFMPVVDGEVLIGVITDRDIVVSCIAEGHDPRGETAEHLMKPEVTTIGPDEELEDAGRMMEREQIRKQAKLARKRLPRRGTPTRVSVLTGAIAGAAAAYFFDPERGRARRALFADWLGARLRSSWRTVNELSTRTTSSAAAFPQRMVQLRSTRPRPADDLTLRDRVESEVFRNPDLPKG